jgi:transposase
VLSLSLPLDVFLFSVPVDLRKSYDGLAALVREHLQREVLDGGLFVFLNKRRDRIKLLYWDRDGSAIWQKRLEVGCYGKPWSQVDSRAGASSVTLTPAELALLLEGVEVTQVRRSPRYSRPDKALSARAE